MWIICHQMVVFRSRVLKVQPVRSRRELFLKQIGSLVLRPECWQHISLNSEWRHLVAFNYHQKLKPPTRRTFSFDSQTDDFRNSINFPFCQFENVCIKERCN